jgi:hypothetical protein
VAFGNILFGGVIGAAVDVASGAAYNDPPLLSVRAPPLSRSTGRALLRLKCWTAAPSS